jgi:hypothetical protein
MKQMGNTLRCFSSSGQVITGTADIVENEDLKSLILTGPMFREPCLSIGDTSSSALRMLSKIMLHNGLNVRTKN